MRREETTTKSSSELEDIITGLRSKPKRIDSRYFYDSVGDKIFQRIMDMPGYYLTDCEREILELLSDEILNKVQGEADPLEVIELGAGDGSKTQLLFKALKKTNRPFVYRPVDVSQNALWEIAERMEDSGIPVDPMQMTYDRALENLSNTMGGQRLILFLGSNIGNMEVERSRAFILELTGVMSPGDYLLAGLDMKKAPHLIRAAYDDAEGVTASFNLNALRHLNREFGANFDLSGFEHEAEYDPESGSARSYLVSTMDQSIHFHDLEESIQLRKGERIAMEVSQKYDEALIGKIFNNGRLEAVQYWEDERSYFRDYLFVRK